MADSDSSNTASRCLRDSPRPLPPVRFTRTSARRQRVSAAAASCDSKLSTLTSTCREEQVGQGRSFGADWSTHKTTN